MMHGHKEVLGQMLSQRILSVLKEGQGKLNQLNPAVTVMILG